TVTCSATDVHNNTATGSFTVSVQGPRAITASVLSQVIALRATVSNPKDMQKLDQVIGKLQQSLDASLWQDQNHLVVRTGDRVFARTKEAVSILIDLQNDPSSSLADAVLQDYINCLVLADRLLAQVAINDAVTGGGDASKISQANQELAKGDGKAAEGNYPDAIGR